MLPPPPPPPPEKDPGLRDASRSAVVDHLPSLWDILKRIDVQVALLWSGIMFMAGVIFGVLIGA